MSRRNALARIVVSTVVAGVMTVGLLSCGGSDTSNIRPSDDQVTITPPGNRAPTVPNRSDILTSVEMREGERKTLSNVSSRFSDPDGDTLTITASLVDPSSFLSVAVSDDQLVLVASELDGLAWGDERVRVTARDPGGLSVSIFFDVRVWPSTGTSQPPRSQPPRSQPPADGPNAAAWAFHCIEPRPRNPGASAVTVQNNCGFDLEIRSGCSPPSWSNARSHPPGTYSMPAGQYTIRANASSADVHIVICRERGGIPRVAVCRKPYTPYFMSPDGSTAGCFD